MRLLLLLFIIITFAVYPGNQASHSVTVWAINETSLLQDIEDEQFIGNIYITFNFSNLSENIEVDGGRFRWASADSFPKKIIVHTNIQNPQNTIEISSSTTDTGAILRGFIPIHGNYQVICENLTDPIGHVYVKYRPKQIVASEVIIVSFFITN